MATWKVARSSKVCALSGRPLAPGSHVATALFGVEEEVSDDKVRGTGFVRPVHPARGGRRPVRAGDHRVDGRRAHAHDGCHGVARRGVRVDERGARYRGGPGD